MTEKVRGFVAANQLGNVNGTATLSCGILCELIKTKLQKLLLNFTFLLLQGEENQSMIIQIERCELGTSNEIDSKHIEQCDP